MKYCEKCKVDVAGTIEYCPLCQRKLTNKGGEEYDRFPYVPTMYNKHTLFFKMMAFISVVAAVICVAINFIIPTEVFWALFVVLGIGCLWIALTFAIKKLGNIPKNILYQVIIFSVLSLIWDKITGWHNWSLNYVIPFLCVGAIICLAVLAWIMKLKFEDFFFYLVMYVVFGIVPVIFLFTDSVTVLYPSLISIGLSIISFAALLIFQGKQILTEIKNRFHM